MVLAISIVASMSIIYKSSLMALDESDILEELREIRKLIEQQKTTGRDA